MPSPDFGKCEDLSNLTNYHINLKQRIVSTLRNEHMNSHDETNLTFPRFVLRPWPYYECSKSSSQARYPDLYDGRVMILFLVVAASGRRANYPHPAAPETAVASARAVASACPFL